MTHDIGDVGATKYVQMMILGWPDLLSYIKEVLWLDIAEPYGSLVELEMVICKTVHMSS